MLKYALQRIFFMLVTLFVIIAICFFLIRLLPLPPLDPGNPQTPIIEARREAMGYNQPLLVQFGIFLRGVLTEWDWGISEQIKPGYDVVDYFLGRMPPTIVVNLYAILVSVPIGLLLGIWAALKKNTRTDHLISTLTMVVISVPSFVYAVLIQYIFFFKLNLLPAQLAPLPDHAAGTVLDYLSPAMLPSMLPAVMALSFGVIAGFTRTMRAELSEVLTGDFMKLARAKGLTRTQATVRHALKNSMVVILPSVFGQFVGILSGSLIIERIFAIPGVGELYIQSINKLDYPMFILVTAFYTAIGLTASIIVDLSYGLIDPRIRMGAAK